VAFFCDFILFCCWLSILTQQHERLCYSARDMPKELARLIYFATPLVICFINILALIVAGTTLDARGLWKAARIAKAALVLTITIALPVVATFLWIFRLCSGPVALDDEPMRMLYELDQSLMAN
jgi:hypothetical protein